MGRTIAAVAIALSVMVLPADGAEYADMKKFVKENSSRSPQGVGPAIMKANSPTTRNFRTQPLWGVRMRGRI